MESKRLPKIRESPSDVCWCGGVNSTVATLSDCFVWKDTSERVARRCDDTSWQRVDEFLCTKTHLFEGSAATNFFCQLGRNVFSNTLLTSCFQNISRLALRNKNVLCALFWNHFRSVWIDFNSLSNLFGATHSEKTFASLGVFEKNIREFFDAWSGIVFDRLCAFAEWKRFCWIVGWLGENGNPLLGCIHCECIH